jgi:hypothetical protein
MIFSNSKKYNFGVCDLLLKNLYIYTTTMDHTFKKCVKYFVANTSFLRGFGMLHFLPFGIPFLWRKKEKQTNKFKEETKEERTVS